MKASILVVDDESDMLHLLKRSLEPELDCHVETASTGESALKKFTDGQFDIVLADIKMPGMNGLELLELIKRNNKEQTVIMMTAYGRIDMAVKAIKSGAYDFVTKPFDHDALVIRLEKALERSSLISENKRLYDACRSTDMFQDIVGKSPAMLRVYETIKMVANTDLTVLITGESGTGKDLTARAVHALSDRKKKPFVAVNCPTVPEQILESELFGYKKGAFTHATTDKKGLFQEANTGTIFLDEIGDISPTIQTKLLRVIQEKEFKPLGDSRAVHVDVRIIASTNQPLKDKIKKGEFREDFFYRLNVLPIKLPPLRERKEDIPLLVDYLLEKHCTKMGKTIKKFSHDLMEDFMSRHWEGNVREMENLIMQGILFAAGDKIIPADLGFTPVAHTPAPRTDDPSHSLLYKEAKDEVLKAFNASYIGRILTLSNGNVTQAAKSCGMERQALQQIMRRYGIKAEPYRK